MDTDKVKNGCGYKYYAFISYKHYSKWAVWAKRDEQWANKIHKYLETWRIPTALSDSLRIHHTDKHIKPVFQDTKQMYAGDEVQDILRENLEQSKSLVVVCSKELIANQRALIKAKKQPYIFDEIKFMLELGRPIILVWIDDEPFDKTSRKCMPEPLIGKDLKVIDVNAFRKKEFFQLKRRVTAEVAASIFKTNLAAFWDIYDRQRKLTLLWIGVILAITLAVVAWLNTQRNMNIAYNLAAEARVEIERGNRHAAGIMAAKAYEHYKDVEGLSVLMHQCLDESLPVKTFNAGISVCEKAGIYAAVEGQRWLRVYSLKNDSLLASFDGYNVSGVTLSPDGSRIAGFSANFLRVFDVRSKDPEPLMELSDGRFERVDFNASGTLLLTQHSHCHGWKLYEVGKKETLYEDIFISHHDKMRWYEETASFLGTDSLLLIYGKMSDLEPDRFSSCKAPHGAKWFCNLYDLRKRDGSGRNRPVLKEELEVPEGTEVISAARNSFAVIMAGPEKITSMWMDAGLGRRITITNRFKEKLISYTMKAYEAYKAENPAWNRFKIVDIKFSGNEKFALLVDESNVLYVVRIDGEYDKMERWNGLIANDEGVKNSKDMVIGVTDEGRPIMYIPNLAHSKNVYIDSKEYLLRPTAYKVPLEDGVRGIQACQTEDGFFYMSLQAATTGIKFQGLSRSYNKGFIFREEPDGILKSFMNRFAADGDTILRALSPTCKYGFLKVKGGAYGVKDRHLLWDMESDCMVACLDDWLKNGEELIGFHANFVYGRDELLMCDCWSRDKHNPNRRFTANLLFDIQKKACVLSGGYFSYDCNGDKVLLFSTDDSTFFFSPEKMQVTLACAGKYGLVERMGRSNRVLIYRLGPDRYLIGRCLYDCERHVLEELPDSLHGKVDAVSADGSLLLVHAKNFCDNMQLLDGRTYEVRAVIPRLTGNGKGFVGGFTPDNRYVVCGDDRKPGVRLFDVRKKNDYILNRYVETAKAPSWNGLPLKGIAWTDKWLVFASHGLIISDLRSRRIKHVFDDLVLPPSPRMMFSPDGRFLLAENYLLDLEQMICLSDDMPLTPQHVTNKGIVYNDAFYSFCSIDELYEKLKMHF